VRAALRAATREAHERVDAGFARFDLSRPDHYGAFLQAHARALLPLEAGLEAAGAEDLLPDWPERARSDALEADLEDLGLPPSPSGAVRLVAGDPALWGVLYALEGSRLGGRVLARRAFGPTRYLTHGLKSGLWPVFLDRLEIAAPEPERAAEGALLVFERFEAALETQLE
jgi:heme oxygenase